MSTFLIVIGFVLALLAHVKLFMFQRSIMQFYYDLEEKYRLDNQESTRPTGVISETHAVPAAKQAHVDSSVLQDFYKLSEAQRNQFFYAIIGQINSGAYASLHLACFSDSSLERASNLQTVLLLLTQAEASRFSALVASMVSSGPSTGPSAGPSAVGPVGPSTGPLAAPIRSAPPPPSVDFAAQVPLPLTDSETDLRASKAKLAKNQLDDSTASSVTKILETSSSPMASTETNETTAAVETRPTTRRNTKKKAAQKPVSQAVSEGEEWRTIRVE